jgi:carboxypeptidase C (cathepsin A)
MELDASLMENISSHYYEAGHMMYAHLPSLQQMKVDMDAFFDTAV